MNTNGIEYNDLDLEKRIIFTKDLTTIYQNKSNISASNTKNSKLISQIKQGQEFIGKQIFSLNQQTSNQSVGLIKKYDNSRVNQPERIHGNQARNLRVDQNNNIQLHTNNQSNTRMKLGLQNRSNHSNIQNSQNLFNSSTDINQCNRQFDLMINYQVQQNKFESIMRKNNQTDLPNFSQQKHQNQFQRKYNSDINLSNSRKMIQQFQHNQQQQQHEILQIKPKSNFKIRQQKQNQSYNPTINIQQEFNMPNGRIQQISTERSDLNTKIKSVEVFDTVLQTQFIKCQNCMLPSNQEIFQLSCLHNYHIECLKELINNNVKIGRTLFLCQCKKKIPQKIIFKLFENNKQVIDTIFKNQLNHLTKKLQTDSRYANVELDLNPEIQVRQNIIVKK